MMRRLLPTIPREPLARFRLLALWFAVAAAFGNGLMIAASSGTPSAFRIAGAAASAALGAWYIWAHRRRRFPPLGWVLESTLMFVAGTASAMPLRALGLFLRRLAVPRALCETTRAGRRARVVRAGARRVHRARLEHAAV
jgi:hypothetical protein